MGVKISKAEQLIYGSFLILERIIQLIRLKLLMFVMVQILTDLPSMNILMISMI